MRVIVECFDKEGQTTTIVVPVGCHGAISDLFKEVKVRAQNHGVNSDDLKLLYLSEKGCPGQSRSILCPTDPTRGVLRNNDWLVALPADVQETPEFVNVKKEEQQQSEDEAMMSRKRGFGPQQPSDCKRACSDRSDLIIGPQRPPAGHILQICAWSVHYIDCLSLTLADGTTTSYGAMPSSSEFEFHGPFCIADGDYVKVVRQKNAAYTYLGISIEIETHMGNRFKIVGSVKRNPKKVSTHELRAAPGEEVHGLIFEADDEERPKHKTLRQIVVQRDGTQVVA